MNDRPKFVLKYFDNRGKPERYPALIEGLNAAISKAHEAAKTVGHAVYVYEYGPGGRFMHLVNPPGR